MRFLAVILVVSSTLVFAMGGAQAKTTRTPCLIKDPAEIVSVHGGKQTEIEGFIRVRCVRKMDLISVRVCLIREGRTSEKRFCDYQKVDYASRFTASVSHVCKPTDGFYLWSVGGVSIVMDNGKGFGSPMVYGLPRDVVCA